MKKFEFQLEQFVEDVRETTMVVTGNDKDEAERNLRSIVNPNHRKWRVTGTNNSPWRVKACKELKDDNGQPESV